MEHRYSIGAMTAARWWGNLLRDTGWAYYLDKSRNQSTRYWHKKGNLTPERIAAFERRLAHLLDDEIRLTIKWNRAGEFTVHGMTSDDAPEALSILGQALRGADLPVKAVMFPPDAFTRHQQGHVIAGYRTVTPGIQPRVTTL